MFENVASLFLFWPESVLVLGLCLLLVVDLVARGASRALAATITLATLAAVVVATIVTAGRAGGLFGAMVARDPYADFFKYLFALCSAVIAVTALRSKDAIDYTRRDADAGEFYALVLGITLGMNLMAAATDLVMAYMSLELVSLLSYVLSGFRRRDLKSSEAALKYAIYGGVASGVMLYGMSLLYGLAGSTSLTGLRTAIGAAGASPIGFVAVAMVMTGFGYKVAAVPFHMWCPDVYEGAPTPVTAFLSVGPKAAGFALLIRFVMGVAPDLGPTGYAAGSYFAAFLGVMAILTMTVGNLVAIAQSNLKRLLAYSSIAHAGYLLMGVTTGTQAGVQAVMFYLAIYLVMNVGAFLVVIAIAEAGLGETLEDYRALGYRAPFAAVVMGIFLFSLTGIPPMAGFIGKFYLFAAVLEKGGPFYVILAIVGVVNSAISLYYYARVLKAMYLEQPAAGAARVTLAPLHAWSLGVLAVVTVVLGLYWAPLISFIGRALGGWGNPATAVAAVWR
ncbi:MAG: NADH-quinone oxidoreductase subunit N [Deltaproteobacteria bacterium]|nr:NADH-quinone oxidoreductase subunit N [Deltaproteobacteria bacterium]